VGYRLATREEVNSLFFDVTGVGNLVVLGGPYSIDQSVTTTHQATSTLIGLLGITLPNYAGIDSSFGQVADQGLYNSMWGETYIQIKVVNNLDDGPDRPKVVTTAGLIQQYQSADSGWFLVKPSEVPLPASVGLFFSAIAGLCGTKFKIKNHVNK
jgi:hypothetical protein